MHADEVTVNGCDLVMVLGLIGAYKLENVYYVCSAKTGSSTRLTDRDSSTSFTLLSPSGVFSDKSSSRTTAYTFLKKSSRWHSKPTLDSPLDISRSTALNSLGQFNLLKIMLFSYRRCTLAIFNNSLSSADIDEHNMADVTYDDFDNRT